MAIEAGMFSVAWREENVIAPFKKGGREKTGNYQTVSLTTARGNMLESIMKDKIKGLWIEQCQPGFMKSFKVGRGAAGEGVSAEIG